MADDDFLRVLADRIQARAVRRMGELLKQFDGRGGDRTKTDGAVSSAPTQAEAARAAHISERQQITAVRVANVAADKFEAAVEAPKPATVTQLAEMGKQIRSVPDQSFKQASLLIGAMSRYAEFCRTNPPESVAAGVMPDEAAQRRADIALIDAWHDRFVVNLPTTAEAAAHSVPPTYSRQSAVALIPSQDDGHCHKCQHCGEVGDNLVEVSRSGVTAHVHDNCLDQWIEVFDRNCDLGNAGASTFNEDDGLDIPDFLRREKPSTRTEESSTLK
jgi:hypothetical protein